MWDYRAKVHDVTDGDTLVLLIDQGLYSRQQEAIRLLNVSAPEHNQLGGMETKKFVTDWLLFRNTNFEWPLKVVTVKNTSIEPIEKRTFTRYLGTIYDIVTGRCLNDDINEFLISHPEWGSGM